MLVPFVLRIRARVHRERLERTWRRRPPLVDRAMMEKRKKPIGSGPSPQIGVRVSPGERRLLDRIIAAAERRASLAPGTITPAAYARSALLASMAAAQLEEEDASTLSEGSDRWERLRESVARLDPRAKGVK